MIAQSSRQDVKALIVRMAVHQPSGLYNPKSEFARNLYNRMKKQDYTLQVLFGFQPCEVQLTTVFPKGTTLLPSGIACEAFFVLTHSVCRSREHYVLCLVSVYSSEDFRGKCSGWHISVSPFIAFLQVFFLPNSWLLYFYL